MHPWQIESVANPGSPRGCSCSSSSSLCEDVLTFANIAEIAADTSLSEKERRDRTIEIFIENEEMVSPEAFEILINAVERKFHFGISMAAFVIEKNRQKKENHRSETATPVPRLLTKGPVTVQGSKTVTDKGSKTVGGTVEAGKKRKGKPSSVWHKKPKKTSSKQKKREIAKEEEEKQIRDDDERREEDERDSIQQSEP